MELELGQRDLAEQPTVIKKPCTLRPREGGLGGIQTGKHASWGAMEGKTALT